MNTVTIQNGGDTAVGSTCPCPNDYNGPLGIGPNAYQPFIVPPISSTVVLTVAQPYTGPTLVSIVLCFNNWVIVSASPAPPSPPVPPAPPAPPAPPSETGGTGQSVSAGESGFVRTGVFTFPKIVRPCKVAIACRNFPGEVDSPITNLSSEAPDPMLWYGFGWPAYDPYRPQLLDDGPNLPVDCSTIVWSSINQENADLMALLATAGCRPPRNDQPTENDQQFTNDAQTATSECADGSVFTFTIPAGAIISDLMSPEVGAIWVQWADAWALALAYQQVWDMMVCINVPIDIRNPPTIPPTPPTPPTPPHPHSGSPKIADHPGWCCLGEDLIPETNTYTLSTGNEAFTFSVVNGMIPLGTSLNQISPRVAVLTGTPLIPGVYTFTIMAVQNSNPNISVKVIDRLNVFGMVTASLPDGTVGTAYSDTQLVTAGGTAPITFTLVGSLPDGLTMTPAGLISGTPTDDGTFDFTVQFTDAAGGTCEQDMTINVQPNDTTCFTDGSTLTGAVALVNYEHFFTPSEALLPGNVWVLTLGSGALPDGLSLSEDLGLPVLVGTPTVPGTYTFEACLDQQPGGGGT